MKPISFFLCICLGLLAISCEPGTAGESETATAETAVSSDSPKPGEKFMKDGKKTIILEAQPWPVGESGVYPAAEGFNAAGSDGRALRLADSIVKYHGGWEAYANTRYFTWNFFGARTLLWDKLEKRVRISMQGDSTIYLVDFSDADNLKGKVKKNGVEVTDPEELAAELTKGHSMWINDSYWLVQHFKLKDSGVTLKYGGEVRTDPQAVRPSYILDMTFEKVGNTPQNMYRLYVDKVTWRINTWQFFRDAKDEEPAMETPWNDYLPYNGLVLSGDRGGRFQLSAIGVLNSVRDAEFTDF
ncbi:hypothetical protein FUA23_04285 [Neolewinella aurantiaca]|uniref:Uncharacterized protein n=1 Tax=Neolewinella aurantiaca TaxID=2602767 RepID=A0A5C7FLW2_9BACT|nr:hypothetical protein [Neolewinella aurantiaca]TXF91029.1 hypothetical protein FUA23_04285 [Neolewinella aurantiaca]